MTTDLQLSTYGKKIGETLTNILNLNEYGLGHMIAEYSLDPFKYYLSKKYNELFVSKKHYLLSKNHRFTFDNMADYFNKIALELGHRHDIIDFQKTGNIITLYYKENENIVELSFILKNNEMYLYLDDTYSHPWAYKDPFMLINLYINVIFRNNRLMSNDILFSHCV
jgi:hypothetical protein